MNVRDRFSPFMAFGAALSGASQGFAQQYLAGQKEKEDQASRLLLADNTFQHHMALQNDQQAFQTGQQKNLFDQQQQLADLHNIAIAGEKQDAAGDIQLKQMNADQNLWNDPKKGRPDYLLHPLAVKAAAMEANANDAYNSDAGPAITKDMYVKAMAQAHALRRQAFNETAATPVPPTPIEKMIQDNFPAGVPQGKTAYYDGKTVKLIDAVPKSETFDAFMNRYTAVTKALTVKNDDGSISQPSKEEVEATLRHAYSLFQTGKNFEASQNPANATPAENGVVGPKAPTIKTQKLQLDQEKEKRIADFEKEKLIRQEVNDEMLPYAHSVQYAGPEKSIELLDKKRKEVLARVRAEHGVPQAPPVETRESVTAKIKAEYPNAPAAKVEEFLKAKGL